MSTAGGGHAAVDAVVDLYSELHAHADDAFARDYFVPGVHRHFTTIGLDPATALSNARVLDAGCGGYGGGIAVALASKARFTVGIDLARANVESARRLYDRPGVRVLQGDLLSLPIEDGSFDFVYCNGVLHHTLDPERAFRELVRVVRPGGRIYIGVYGRTGLFNAIARPAAIAIGRMIPRRLMTRLVAHVPLLLRPSTSVLDFMYAPIQQRYHRREIVEWFQRAGLSPRFLRHYYQPDTLLGHAIYGDGTMLFFTGVKAA